MHRTLKCSSMLVDYSISVCTLVAIVSAKPTNYGTKAADAPDIFSSHKHKANPPTILVHLQSLCAPRGKELGESQRDRCCPNQKPTHVVPIPVNTKSCSICHRLAVNVLSKYNSQFDTPYFVGGWVRPRASIMVPIEMSTPHSYSTSLHTIGLCCTV